MDRLERYPDMHVYHYAAYEPTALKKLMGRHGTCEDEVDRLLRGGVFVDLFRAVRQGVRASIGSYSIKRLEPLYGFARAVDLKDATNSLRQFETYLGLGGGGGAADPNILRKIEAYNRDDCLSARQLRWWLEAQRLELERQTGNPLPRPNRPDPEPTEAVREETARVLAVVERLTEGVPADPKARTDEQQGRWLLAQLLEWHRREEKSSWWEYYRLVELTDADLVEDSRALGGLEYVGEVGVVKKSTLHRYRFDPKEHDIRPGKDVRDPRTRGNPGDVHAVDDKAGTMDLKRGTRSKVPHPTAVIPYDLVRSKELKASLLRIGTWVAEHGIDTEGLYQAARDLLLGRPPRVGAALGARLLSDGEEELVAARRLVRALDCSVLPVQGPPGSGKTYTGARMIIELLCEGKKVGITANSHRVICKLLEEVLAAARDEGVGIRAIQKVKEEEEGHQDASVELTEDNARVVSALGEGTNLAAGTAWLWARPEMAGAVEVLFVDEAGQMSLANVIAVSPAASSLVLLGDPQQLDQPQKGVHPPGADTSALGHLLGNHVTIPAVHGIFLARTRRNASWRLRFRLSCLL